MLMEIQGIEKQTLSSQGQPNWYYKAPKKRSGAFQAMLDGEMEELEERDATNELPVEEREAIRRYVDPRFMVPDEFEEPSEEDVKQVSENLEKLLGYAGLLGME